jgi:FAD/FMN-containing dehydrogenase
VLPQAIAVPSTTNALVDLVRWAGETGTPLIPRGAGSGMPGHNVGPGVIVDLTVLDGLPIEIDRPRFLASTGAGVSLGDLAEVAGRIGLRMPVDPSSARWATAGGVVATNAAGSRSVKYGPVRRWVEGLTLVTADAEVVRLDRQVAPPRCRAVTRFQEELEPTLKLARWRVASTWPKVRKNTAGYPLDAYLASGDLVDLVIGAEGTLGVVTEVTWRLEPIPASRRAVRAAIRSVRRLATVVPALLDLDPSRVEFLDGTFLHFVGEGLPSSVAAVARGGALLMIEFEGESVAERVERAVEIAKPESAEVLVASGDAEIEALWSVRHAASPRLAALGDQARSLQVVEDGCVPIDRLGDYIAGLHAVADKRGIPIVMFGHAGDGHVHANLLADLTEPDWEGRVRGAFADGSQLVASFGGSPAGEHGDGRLRAGLLQKTYGWEVVQLFRHLKRVFDPAGILNPGVKLGDADPISALKVGAGAAAIPADIERGLRWIESHGGYATARLSIADHAMPITERSSSPH